LLSSDEVKKIAMLSLGRGVFKKNSDIIFIISLVTFSQFLIMTALLTEKNEGVFIKLYKSEGSISCFPSNIPISPSEFILSLR